MNVKRLEFAWLCAFALIIGGCRIGRYYRVEPIGDHVMEVVSGDRYYFDFNENRAEGEVLRAESDDDDVEITYEKLEPDSEHGLGQRRRVCIRVHRGFAGPATVTVVWRNRHRRKTLRTVNIVLTHDGVAKANFR